jgi:outer membrane protein OmpA-like peptidoglycan-associated protein
MSRSRGASKQKKDEQGSSGLKRARTSEFSRGTPSGLPHKLFEAGNTAVGQLLGGLSSGKPLDPSVQAQMEQAFGADFGEVRIHDDATARARAGEISSEAFTHGDDIYLADDASSSGTAEGKRLLAHELAHVVQQRRAGGRQSSAVGEPGDRFETDADQAAAHAAAGRPVQVTESGAPPASVQRQPAEQSLGEKALDYILEKGISWGSEGWKIGPIAINDVKKIPEAAKTAVSILAKIVKGDLKGAVEIVNPKNPEDRDKAWEKVRRIKEEVDSLRDAETRQREKHEERQREEEERSKVIRERAEKLGQKPLDPKFDFPELRLSEGLRGGTITHVLLDEFDLEKSQLKSKHHRKLNDLAAQVMADPDAELEIVGHTDSSGPDNFNNKLSDQRAKAVVAYLIKRGVASGKIKSVTGKGKSEPFVEEKTDADRAQNRRVEIFYKPSVVKEKHPGFGSTKLRLDK